MSFKGGTQVHIIPSQHEANDPSILVIYDSGTDRHYITKEDRQYEHNSQSYGNQSKK